MSVLRNHQIAILALREQAKEEPVSDMEDVAITADRLAPGRFRWRKHCQHIDLGAVHKALRDARAMGWTQGGARGGWGLSESGRVAAEELLTEEQLGVSGDRLSPDLRRWRTSERARLLAHPVYVHAASAGAATIGKRDAMKLFRLDEYVTVEQRRIRIERLLHAFRDDPQLGPILTAIAGRVTDE